MGEIRVLIADDEPIVRRGLRALLESIEGISIVGEARNGAETVEMVRQARPDLLFLDVQMPELDGFQALEALKGEPLPEVVFVTAYDVHAIRAFEVHAVDYLLKPFDEERFHVAMGRARSRLRERRTAGLGRQIEAVLAELASRGTGADAARDAHTERLLVKHDGRVTVVQVDDIDWVEAADNYVRIHTRTARYLVREPIKSIEQRLPPRRFARVHRSAIVNLSRVRELHPMFGGEYQVVLSTGARLTLSRGYRDAFRERLESNG